MFRPLCRRFKNRSGHRCNRRKEVIAAAVAVSFLLLAATFLCIPAHAATYPVEVFEGTWEPEAGFTGDYYFNMTFSFSDDTMTMDFYEEFMGGTGTNTWTGPYTYDPATGTLKATLSNVFQIGSKGAQQTRESSIHEQLIDLNRFVSHDASGKDIYYKRISEPPVLPEEEEEEEPEETEPEETEEAETEDVEESEEEPEEEEEETEEAEEAEEDLEEEEEVEEEPEEPEEIDLDNADEDTILKWLLNTDDEHLNEMKSVAVSMGTTLGAIVIGLLSSGAAGGPGGLGAAGAGGMGGSGGVTIPDQYWQDYQNEINRQVAQINQSMDDYQRELERQWEEAGVGVYDKQRYQDMMAERENQAWIERERQKNMGPSREAIEWSAEKKAMERDFAEQDKKNKLFYKKGIYDCDYKEFKKQWIRNEMQEAEMRSWAEQREAYADAGLKTAENIKAGADIAIDVMAELEPTGAGKGIKNTYKILAEAAGQTGEVMAGNQSFSQAVGKTLVNSTVEFIKDNVDSTEAKLFSNVSGDGIKGYFNARIEGKSHAEALKEGSSAAKQGFVNFAVDYSVGKGMDGLTGGVKIGDRQVYNGLYKNSGIKGEGATRWATDLAKNGFTDGVIKNDNVKNAVGALVSDTIKNNLPE
ncbi:MAG: hypothetical protein J5518_01640 [Lachnospiraceae bacterium]|nr:hypothetical protein [Lachnospiraceae bacterium]